MPDIAVVIQAGAQNPWFYLPIAVLLGALHALEPGHAKSVMAAFIVAVRGTARQAVLLGTAAAIGHSLVIWLLAILGLAFGDALILEHVGPWMVLATGMLIVILALRILHAIPRHGHHDHDDHDEQDDQDNNHVHHDDTHAAQHAKEIARYTGRTLTNGEIFWFGLTGGLLPCPSALAVLLVCINLKAFTLGFAMVVGFSLGLALTLIAVGLVAAWGVKKSQTGSGRFLALSAKLPYVSAGLVLLIGLVMVGRGLAIVVG